jgi:hypothetical protein
MVHFGYAPSQMLEQAQLEVGLGMRFLSTCFELYGFLLTDCLWSSIWSFISTNNISLSYPDQVLPQRQRAGDQFIMERLVQQAGLTQKELISCNRCRLAIEAGTLADITTGILGWSPTYTGIFFLKFCSSLYNKLEQKRSFNFAGKQS